MAKALTPLSLSSVSDDALKAAKILFTTSEGKGHDEKYVAKRAVKVNPENTCAIVRNGGDDNESHYSFMVQRANETTSRRML